MGNIKLEHIVDIIPTFSSQLENKIIYTKHSQDIGIAYNSTYTLKYVLEGSKQYQFNNQTINVAKNQYLILNNNQTIHTEIKKGTKGLSLFLSPELVHEIYSYHTNDTPIRGPLEFYECTQLKPDDTVGFWLGQIISLLEKNSNPVYLQMDDIFIKLSETIIKDQLVVNKKFNELKIIKNSTKRALYRSISLAKEFMNDNYNHMITLDTICDNVGISKYHLHRIFSEITGCTPLAYLSQVRLKNAKNKLQYTQASIAEIAFECGFENWSYFSTLFKKHVGCTPSQYRKCI